MNRLSPGPVPAQERLRFPWWLPLTIAGACVLVHVAMLYRSSVMRVPVGNGIAVEWTANQFNLFGLVLEFAVFYGIAALLVWVPVVVVNAVRGRRRVHQTHDL